jgi:repressor LexA
MGKTKEPGKKQREILDYIKKEILTRGYPPTVREICTAVGLKSTASVYFHLNALEEKGLIARDPDKPRAIEILDDDFQDLRIGTLSSDRGSTIPTPPDDSVVQVPVIGRVAAGTPLLAVEQIETYLPMPVDRLPNNQCFILKVRGDSMINAGIFSGDYVVVEKTPSAENGDIVVALLGDSATVKTFYREKDCIRLQPENDTMEPIIVRDQLDILGKVFGVFRFF